MLRALSPRRHNLRHTHTPTAQELERAKYGEVSNVFGFVYEHTTAGVVPLRNFPLAVQGRSATGSFITVDVLTDATGRYDVPDMQREYLAAPRDHRMPTCRCAASFLWGWKDEAYNVHVTSRANLPLKTTRSRGQCNAPAGLE